MVFDWNKTRLLVGFGKGALDGVVLPGFLETHKWPIAKVETPANWTDIPPPPVFKTALCKFFEQGNCTNGDSCTYAHGVEELQPLYKAKLCNFFLQGVCTRGANCTFAHGIEELQGDGSAVSAVPQAWHVAVKKTPRNAHWPSLTHILQGLCSVQCPTWPVWKSQRSLRMMQTWCKPSS